MASRQYRWQLRKIAAGRCMICGKARVTANFCAAHAKEANKRHREDYRARTPAARPMATHCRSCGKRGHNARTCAAREREKAGAMSCRGGAQHRFQMVGERNRGAEVTKGWVCTQLDGGPDSHEKQAVIGCFDCCGGWCVDCIPDESQREQVRTR